MAIAGFVVLIIVALVVLVFAIYGLFLGMARLGRLVARAYEWLVAPDADLLRYEKGAPLEQLMQLQPASSCWDLQQCPPKIRDSCPAYIHSNLPCWVACMLEEPHNKVKPDCLSCRCFSLPELAA